MTLNIDLEDVPFAILEAVKARILANRRRLQQGRRVPLRLKPQFVEQGASSKGWRLPKQPAVVLEGDKGATGLAWVVTPDYSINGYYGSWIGFPAPAGKQPLFVGDAMPLRVGSGDGSQWVSTTLNLPGINAWGAANQYFGDIGTTPPFDGSEGVFITRGEYGFFDDFGLLRMALPVGNGAAIVLVGFRSATSAFGWQNKTTAWMEFPVLRSNYERIALEPTTFSGLDIKAFLVSDTTCREVPIPSGITSVLDILWPETTWVPTTGYANYGNTIFTYTVPLPNASGYAFYSNSYINRKLELALGSRRVPAVVPSFGTSQTAINDDWGKYDDTIRPGEDRVATVATSTPAIYGLLRNYEATFNAFNFLSGNAAQLSTATIKAQLRNLGFPVPNHWVTIDANDPALVAFNAQFDEESDGNNLNREEALYRSDMTGLQWVKSNTMPEKHTEQTPEGTAWARLSRLRFAADRSFPSTPEKAYTQVLWHYDWAEPQYCRQQLLALGFTAADLKP